MRTETRGGELRGLTQEHLDLFAAMGVETIIRAFDYDLPISNRVLKACGYDPLTATEMEQIRMEILSGRGPLIRRIW